MIDIEVNGERHRVAARTTLRELLDALDLPDQGIALAVNRSVVPRRQWSERQVAASDRIDIVRAIGGG
ncbi:MAG: sulfur carrier protein ThiS [Gammaproteobacteria bacterium]